MASVGTGLAAAHCWGCGAWGMRNGGTMWASSPTKCNKKCYASGGRCRGYPCRTRLARVRVSGQRMAAQRRYESKAVNLSARCAGQKGLHTGRIPGAERIPKPWFWRRSLGTFCRCWQKVPRGRHDKGCGASPGGPSGTPAPTGAWYGVLASSGGGVWSPRPTGAWQGVRCKSGGGARYKE